MWHNEVLTDYLKDWLDMTDDDIKRKISKVVVAGRKAVDPSFRTYWQNTAKSMASKYNVNLSDIENNLELNSETKVDRLH